MKLIQPAMARYGPNGIGVALSRPLAASHSEPTTAPTSEDSRSVGSTPASPVQAPISPFVPHELTAEQVEETIEDFVRCAALAQEAGYDGIEVMGSEGYLINQFLVERTNRRNDDWGGTPEKRRRFAACCQHMRHALAVHYRRAVNARFRKPCKHHRNFFHVVRNEIQQLHLPLLLPFEILICYLQSIFKLY